MLPPVKQDRPCGWLVPLTPRDEIGQGALAGAVGPPQGMDLCTLGGQAEIIKDLGCAHMK